MEAEESPGKDLKSIIRLVKAKLLNRNVAVFSFFLLLSFVFWYINALSKDLTGSVSFPVRYINMPENLALVNELPEKVDLELEGPGYSVLRVRISGNKTPLVIDVDNTGLTVKDNKAELEFFIYSKNLKESFLKQLRSDLDISSIKPDTLDFIFDKVSVRKVPVKPDIIINTQKQFMVSGDIIADPDSVEISGPATIIDTISFVKTEKHEFDQVKENITRNLELVPIRKVGISHKKTELTIPVEQYTEEVIDVGISILNKPDTANVRLFPDMVTVTFNIALSDYDRIQEVSFYAAVNMENLDVRTVERLNVELVNLPPFISNVRYNPRQVEYIIEKK